MSCFRGLGWFLLADKAACVATGLLVEEGIGLPADATRAAGLYLTACDSGFLRGGKVLGRSHDAGRGVPVDAVQVATPYRNVCEGVGVGSRRSERERPQGCLDLARACPPIKAYGES